MNDSVVILIISHKAHLDSYEMISLQQCYKILGNYPIQIVCPEGLNVEQYRTFLPNPCFDFIPAHWQSTYKQFNQLKVEPFLYQRYCHYKYILFYEPDAFVFRDELKDWCAKKYDYIGAVWFDKHNHADETSPMISVGNGGFSLRNVPHTLRILKHLKTIELLNEYAHFNWKGTVGHFYTIFQRWRKEHKELPKIIKHCPQNEDAFWGEDVNIILEELRKNTDILSRWYCFLFPLKFKVASIEEAIPFSFEVNPKRLYRENKYQLPFGCHAWYKYDLEFWKPFIKAFGYHV